MGKLVIAGKNKDNVFDFLVDDFYMVHPEIYINNGKLIKNFDVYLNFDEYESNSNFVDILNYYNVPVIGHNRLPKWKQMELARSLGIDVPNTYKQFYPLSKEYLSYSIFKFLESYSETQQFILKAENGARGIGQMIIRKNQIYDLYRNIALGKIDNDYLTENFILGENENFNDDSENDFLKNCLLDLDFSVMEKLNIKKEWRYIYIYKSEPIIIERSVNQGDNWQSNVSVTGEGKHVPYNDMDEEHLYMREKSNLIAGKLNVPVLSIDFYMGEQGEIGIFEFQMQMGFKKVNKSELTTKFVDGFKQFIKDKI